MTNIIDDNECFKWCLVRYLHLPDHNPARIKKPDKDFAEKLKLKDVEFPVKTRDILQIEKKKNLIRISVIGYENKEKCTIYVSKKCCEDKHVDSLLIREEGFNTFMYDHLLHRGRKHFCHYCLHAFIAEEILKHHHKDCFKINGKQNIQIPKKSEYVRFKNYERKIKSPFMIYADFESILVPEDNEKQNPNESYTNK